MIGLVLSICAFASSDLPWDVALTSYKAMAIVGDPDDRSRHAEDRALLDSLSAKAEALKAVELQISQHEEGREIFAAMAHADANEEMASALRRSEVPFYLTESQVQVYRMALEDKAWLHEEQAVLSYKEAMRLASGTGSWSALALQRLQVLRPAQFPSGVVVLSSAQALRDRLERDPRDDEAALHYAALLMQGQAPRKAVRVLEKYIKAARVRDPRDPARVQLELIKDAMKSPTPHASGRNPELPPGPTIADLAEQITTFRAAFADRWSCLEPDLVDEVGMVLEQAEMVVEAVEAAMARDIQILLEVYEANMNEACPIAP